MSNEEYFESLKADYIKELQKRISLIESTSYDDLKKVDVKNELASSMLRLANSFMKFGDFIRAIKITKY